MPTNSDRVEIVDNRLLSKKDLKDYFLEYIEALTDETVAAFLQGKSGVFESTDITMVEGGTTEEFYLHDLTTPKRVAVATGKVITLYGSVVGETSEIAFENAVGINYEVGIRWNRRPYHVDINPKRGYPEYQYQRDVFGEVGAPDTVTDGGTYIRLWIDSLTDPLGNHSFAGRKAVAWMNSPVSGDDSLAFYEGTIAYDGGTGSNYLQIPYSGGAGPLGQDTSASAPSTTATDYRVHVKGPSMRIGTNTVLKTDKDNYAFIGSITGAGVGSSATYSTVGQVKVFLITLDNAYDGQGSGAGNEINVDVASKPVTLNSFQTSGSIRPTQKMVLEMRDPDDSIQYRVEQYGRIATTPRFSDEFNYAQSTWAAAASAPTVYVATEGSGVSKVRSLVTTSAMHPKVFGALNLISASGAATHSRIQGLTVDYLERRPRFYARFAVDGLEATHTCYMGIGSIWSSLTGPILGFRAVNGVLVGYYKPVVGAALVTSTLLNMVDGDFYDCYFVAIDNVNVEFWVTGMTTPVNLTIGDDLDDSLVDWNLSLGARVDSEVGSVNDHDLVIDFWEIQLNDRIRSAQ